MRAAKSFDGNERAEKNVDITCDSKYEFSLNLQRTSICYFDIL